MSDHHRIDTFTLTGAGARFQRAVAFEDPKVAFHIEVNGHTLNTNLFIRCGPGPEDFQCFGLTPNALEGLANGLRECLDFVKAKQAERGPK